MHTSVEKKWDKTKHEKQFQEIFQEIDKAIEERKTLIILPESVFPIFLNYEKKTYSYTGGKSKKNLHCSGRTVLGWENPSQLKLHFYRGKDYYREQSPTGAFWRE